MPNKDIEWFKRFATAHMRWIHFEFDRIVDDAVKRQERIKAEEDKLKEKLKFENTIYGKLVAAMREYRPEHFGIDLFQAMGENIKIGSQLKIRLPANFKS